MAAHRKKIQIRTFQIVQLRTKRDGRLLSQVEAIKPRVLESKDMLVSGCTPWMQIMTSS